MENKHFENSTELEKIDLENGEILEVSLITTGEIQGHGMHLDEAGLDSFMKCIEGTQVKAYYKHSEDNEALSSIGYFENFQKKEAGEDNYKIVGDFSALNAWKESNESEYKTFFELATVAPEVFGISVEALIKSAWYNANGDLVNLDEEMPTEDTKIYAFCEKVLAWSVVSTPATNPNGLFSQELEKEEELVLLPEGNEVHSECTLELEEKITVMELELNTVMDLATELKLENESLSDEKAKLKNQIQELENKLEALDIGSEPIENKFVDVELDISAQISNETDWGKKSKLIMNNLNNLELQRTEQGTR